MTYEWRAEDVVSHIENQVMIDPYCYYSLERKPIQWSEGEIKKFMEKLALTMCHYDFMGFTLSAENATTHIVTHNPYDFCEWKLNGKPSSYSEILNATIEVLHQPVYWIYTEL
jgi:hypothetical protein